MDLFSLISRPIRNFKDVFDLNRELDSPSLASQFAAVKCQLAEVRRELHECRRIAREKDELIAKLQEQMSVERQTPQSMPASVRQDETYSPDGPVLEST